MSTEMPHKPSRSLCPLETLGDGGMTPVGSRTGAVARRGALGCVRGFPLRARLGFSVAPFPVPFASHAACGFPALRAPAHFWPKVMRPITLRALPAGACRPPGNSLKSPRSLYSNRVFHLLSKPNFLRISPERPSGVDSSKLASVLPPSAVTKRRIWILRAFLDTP